MTRIRLICTVLLTLWLMGCDANVTPSPTPMPPTPTIAPSPQPITTSTVTPLPATPTIAPTNTLIPATPTLVALNPTVVLTTTPGLTSTLVPTTSAVITGTAAITTAATTTPTVVVRPTATPPARVFTFGKLGTGNGELSNPTGIAVSSEGIFVVERDNNRVQRFTLQGQFVWKAGTGGNGTAQLSSPSGAALFNNLVYVADTNNGRVAIFSTNGAFVRNIGVSGDDVNQLRAPVGVALDAVGKLFVADRANRRAQVYETDDEPLRMSGAGTGQEGTFGAFGAGGVIVDAKDSLYASDTSNDRILAFDFRGKYLFAFGGTGSENGKLLKPLGLALDKNGRILVADSGNRRIAIFAPDGKFIENKTADELGEPSAVAVDANDVMYVTDSKNHRVVVIR
jgi:outer membrane protein assembly factor BamB